MNISFFLFSKVVEFEYDYEDRGTVTAAWPKNLWDCEASWP